MENSTKDKIRNLRKKYSCEVYNTLLPEYKEESMYKFSKKGITLHSIARSLNVDMIIGTLDKISIPKGFQLSLEKQFSESFGQYYFYITAPDGTKSQNIFDFIEVEDSRMGAWQAYLLYTLWHILPLNDHSNSCARQFIFLDQDVESIKMVDKNPVEELEDINTDLKVLQYESHYFISCCYWSRFKGLIRELVEIEITEGRAKEFIDVIAKDVYVYEYGRNIRL